MQTNFLKSIFIGVILLTPFINYAQIVMPASGSASTTVGSTAVTFYDPGGVGNYSNNVTSVQTICPTISTEKVRIMFSALDTETTNDYLEVYMGNAVSGSPAATLSGTTTPIGIASTSANGCLTFQFVSNTSIVSSGFTASLESINFVCGTGNPTPADACSSATPITNLSGFCGTTTGYTVDGTLSGCAAVYSIDNNSWLKFTASASSAVIDYAITGGSNCGGATGSQNGVKGVQLAVVSGTCGSTMTSLSCARNPTGGIGASGTWNLSGLTPGTSYYIFIDGYAGATCDYSFAGQSGILACDISTITTTPTTCSAGTYGLSGIVSYSTPPASGNLIIKVDGITQQTIAMPGGGWGTSSNYSITGLTANGASHTVSAEFAANTGCTNSATYTSPAACTACAVGIMTLTTSP